MSRVFELLTFFFNKNSQTTSEDQTGQLLLMHKSYGCYVTHTALMHSKTKPKTFQGYPDGLLISD